LLWLDASGYHAAVRIAFFDLKSELASVTERRRESD